MCDKEFKEIIIRMLNKLESTIEELREHFKKEVENVTKNQWEVNDTVAEMNKLEGIDNRLVNIEKKN